ncbi:MAG: beta-lactamase [Xanthobacteraceae bacterium]|jgi:beta-lactamase class A|nr:beta-lactamase [Xanthobacteraceae bacterium]
MIDRRTFTAGLLPLIAGLGVLATTRPIRAAATLQARLQDELARLETQSGGRLGVAVIDIASGAQAGHRATERFPMCSTFKMLASAAILARCDAGKDTLGRRVRYEKKDLVDNSPFTEKHLADGMTLEELCEASMIVSDNTAVNLMLETIGGPAGMTAYFRTLGDAVTRLDRIETMMSESKPGDPRDTTSPEAMAGNVRRLVLEDALSPTSRQLLTDWLIANRTGDDRLRAGLPAGWRAAEKTGSGGYGTTNDVGIFWPPGRPPVIISTYLTQSTLPRVGQNATLASVARAVAAALAD